MCESPILDHSARHEPALPGFPVLISRISAFLIFPHIRAAHESREGRAVVELVVIIKFQCLLSDSVRMLGQEPMNAKN